MSTAIVEASIILRCVNRASREFERVSADARTLEDRMKGLSRGVAGLGALTVASARLAGAFGLVSPQAERVFVAMGAMEIAIALLTRAEIIAKAVTWAYNTALTVKIALLGLGVGLVIAMATAMAALAVQTKIANREMREFSAYAPSPGGYGVRHEYEAMSRRGMEY